jgi:hypothetical protein
VEITRPDGETAGLNLEILIPYGETAGPNGNDLTSGIKAVKKFMKLHQTLLKSTY